MKAKKFLLGLGLALLGGYAYSQNGLEAIVVEKYYVSNAADAAGSIGTLPTGSVTYRVYADMLPGYNLQAVYGVANHELKITSSTSFFNNEDYGGTTPTGISVTNTRKNSVMLDSWFSMGGNAAGKVAVLKTEDTDGALVNSSGILQNNDPSAGLPINTHDGMLAGTAPSVTFVGLNNTGNGDLGVFDGTSQVGGTFSSFNGSIAVLGGVVGPTAANRVLIGQFTTNGVFQFELNVQIGTPLGGTQNFVANNPVGAEISIPSLTRVQNTPPTVSVTAPVNGANIITGDVVAITASATDPQGIAQVEFFVDNVSIGIDNTAPYSINWTSTVGAHTIKATATDADIADPLSATSSDVNVNVANNQAPSISVSAPATAIVGDAVSITSATGDVDGTVTQVEFFVDNVSIGIDNTAPFTMNWTAVVGVHSIKGTATDDRGATTTSAVVTINVANNIPPTAAITSPTSGAAFTAPQVVTIDASASDADGTVTQVEFFVNNVSVGIDATSPYSFNWTSVIGNASLTVKSTDNKGAVTTSAAVNLNIADPNALPYRVATTSTTCLIDTICVPLEAVDTVDNVIGYDVVMNYDPAKLTPTGVVTMAGSLINPAYVDIANSVTPGVINISAYFNSNAPINAEFSGTGEIFCVQFVKTGVFSSIDSTDISVSSLQESYNIGVSTKLVETGEYTSYKDSIYTGSLKFWTNSSAIPYNSANPNDYLITNIYGTDATCGNKSLLPVQPDLNGQFVHSIWNGVNVQIERDVLATTSVQPVVNGFDALQVRKLLINDPTFVPNIYQAIAMDVNMDGVISAGDVSQINQRAVLILPEFKQAWNYNAQGVSNGQPSKDWLFLDSIVTLTNPAYAISATFPNNDGVGFSKYKVPVVPFCSGVTMTDYPNCPDIAPQTYFGVMLGDINGNYAGIANDGLVKQGSTEKVVFNMSGAKYTQGYVDIPVSIVSTINVNSLDFAMQFNDAKLSYNSIVNHASYIQALDNLNNNDNTLRFTSNSMQNYDLSKPVVSVRFAISNGQINQADLHSMVAYLNGEEVNVEVVDAVSATGVTSIDNASLVNIYPNPATNVLNVVAYENAIVQLLDINGKEILFQTNLNANNKEEINTESIANGIYMVKVYNDNFVTIKKVVINK